MGSLSVAPQGGGSNLVLLSEPVGGFSGPLRVSMTAGKGTLLDRPAPGTDCVRLDASEWQCKTDGAQTVQFLVRASDMAAEGPTTLHVEAMDDAGRTFKGDATLPSGG